jgi:hypothetical protein
MLFLNSMVTNRPLPRRFSLVGASVSENSLIIVPACCSHCVFVVYFCLFVVCVFLRMFIPLLLVRF